MGAGTPDADRTGTGRCTVQFPRPFPVAPGLCAAPLCKTDMKKEAKGRALRLRGYSEEEEPRGAEPPPHFTVERCRFSGADPLRFGD